MEMKITHNDKKYIVKYSPEDHTIISKYNWRIFKKSSGNKYYVFAGYGIWMHRLIMNCPQGLIVDHINGNGLDNRRENLRTLTTQQNCQNKKKKSGTSSIYKGLTKVKQKTSDKYIVAIKYNHKRVHIGSFSNETEGAKAYDMYVVHNNLYHPLNFPEKRIEYLKSELKYPIKKKKKKYIGV